MRIYTAAGEAADLQEMLGADGIELCEISDLDELHAVPDPAVLFLSRGLLGGGGTHESLGSLPPHIVVVAADDGARSAAGQADRLFLAAPDLAPGDAPLLRALRSASRHAEVEAERVGLEGSADIAQLCRRIEERVHDLPPNSAKGLAQLDADLVRILETVRRHRETKGGSADRAANEAANDMDGAPATPSA